MITEELMKLKIFFVCMLIVIGSLEISAEMAPVKSWNKVLPGNCYFSAFRGDTVIAITDRVVLLSKDGQIINQSPPVSDFQNLVSGRYTFEFLKDNTVLLLKDKYTLKKIGLSGETLWFKNLRDSIPNLVCNDLLEDKDGTLYLCGDVSYQAAFLVKISRNGAALFSQKYEAFGSFYAIAADENTLYLSTSNLSTYQPSKVVSFDTTGNFIKTIIDKSNANVLSIRNDLIISLGVQGGAALFKAVFFATRDIVLKKFDTNGEQVDSVLFDFGKYETPKDLIWQKDGLIMVSVSDETVNMGTNILNYFVTKVNDNLQKEWQFKFGTDSSDYMNETHHYRSYYTDEKGCVLAVHNDTLSFYKVFSTRTVAVEKSVMVKKRNSREFDLNGRLLYCDKALLFPHAANFILETNGTSSKKKVLDGGIKNK